MVAVGRDDADLAAAVNGVASLIAFYGSTPAYLPVLEVEGWADIQPELNALSKQGRFAEMRALITEPMVDRIGDHGNARAMRAADRSRGSVITPARCAATSPATPRVAPTSPI